MRDRSAIILDAGGVCEKFSKVSSLLNLPYTMATDLTFENFHLVVFSLCKLLVELASETRVAVCCGVLWCAAVCCSVRLAELASEASGASCAAMRITS